MLRLCAAAVRRRAQLELASAAHASCAAPPRGFASEAAEPLRSRRFVDWLRVVARAGNGGSGCVSFWHAPARSKRGPDGGPGGRGGDVVLRADRTVRCLAHVSTSACGEAGGKGGAQGRAGKRGADCVVRVPVGTVVWERLDEPGGSDDDSEDEQEEEDDLARRARAQAEAEAEAVQRRRQARAAAQPRAPADDASAVRPGGGYGRNYRPALRLLADLSEAGATAVVARGGRGGRGNASLDDSKLGSQRDASEAGGEGDVVPLLLELKAVADVGLVGAPNVGKSTLLASLTNARPEVADYAFTTLRPQLGRVQAAGPDGGGSSRVAQAAAQLLARATLADIPGLVEGAHANRGLGHAFLRHVERCAALLLVVDLASGASGRPGARAAEQLRVLRDELRAYDPAMADRPHLVVGTKLDVAGAARALAGLRRSATAAGLPQPLGVSAATGEGMEELRAAVLHLTAMAERQPQR